MQSINDVTDYISLSMKECEQSPVKISQYRNVRIATVVPEMIQSILPRAIVRFIQLNPTCDTTNSYSQRTKSQFVPFVYTECINSSLIICESRVIAKYQQECLTREVSHIVITSVKQLKTLSIDTLNSVQVVIIYALIIKELAKALQQSTTAVNTQQEEQQYIQLVQHMQQESQLTSVLSQMVQPNHMPVFVKQEILSQGLAFQRVIIDPSSLNAVKYEVIGKFLWIFSTAFEFSPTQHSGSFWKQLRTYMPLRQQIQEINQRFDKLTLLAFAFDQIPIHMDIYAKPKIKLPCYQMPNSISQSQFLSQYDLQQLQYDQNTIKQLVSIYKKHNWLHKQASILPNILSDCMNQNCPICLDQPAVQSRVLIPCCIQSMCFNCFYKILRRGFKCTICKKAYLTEHMFQLIVYIYDGQIDQIPQLVNKPELIAQLNTPQAIIIDLRESDKTNIYRIAQKIAFNPTNITSIHICYDEPLDQESIQAKLQQIFRIIV